MLAGGLSSSLGAPLRRLLGCPHDVMAGFPQSQTAARAKLKHQCLLRPFFECHTLSPLLHSLHSKPVSKCGPRSAGGEIASAFGSKVKELGHFLTTTNSAHTGREKLKQRYLPALPPSETKFSPEVTGSLSLRCNWPELSHMFASRPITDKRKQTSVTGLDQS